MFYLSGWKTRPHKKPLVNTYISFIYNTSNWKQPSRSSTADARTCVLARGHGRAVTSVGGWFPGWFTGESHSVSASGTSRYHIFPLIWHPGKGWKRRIGRERSSRRGAQGVRAAGPVGKRSSHGVVLRGAAWRTYNSAYLSNATEMAEA